MSQRTDTDGDRDYDPKGEYGGDTGKTDQLGKGVQAEKGDQRRGGKYHDGPTRSDVPGNRHDKRKRSGSDSNASR